PQPVRRHVSRSPSPPSAAIPSFLQNANATEEELMKAKFRKFWMASVADGFKDDLEEIRKEPTLGTSRLAVLIDGLAAGGDVVPMARSVSIERMHDHDPTGLISPPPEETLQIARTSVPKRKRATPQPQQTTPNPKPRKQTRRPSPVESPIRPALPVRTRRTTPIPAYEPPTDVFTPPRVVIKTPTISKSSKRKSTNRRRPSTAELFVKIEPPQIDLSAPHSPGSPSDDPILLSVPSSSPIRPRRKDAAVSTDALFDVTDPSVCVWSDDDDDNLVEGDYTGSFRSFNIRTKLDPPSSATRERQEEWGRPITPFPYRKIERLDLLKEEDEQEECQAGELSLDTLCQESVVPEPTHRGPFDFDESFDEDDSNMEQDIPVDSATEEHAAVSNLEDEEAEKSVEQTRASASDMNQDDTSIEEVPASLHDVEHEETEMEPPAATHYTEQDTDEEADTSIEEVPALVYHVDGDDNEPDTSIEEVPALVYDMEHEEAETSIEEAPAAAHYMEQDDDEADMSIEEAPEVVHDMEQDDNEADTSTEEPTVVQNVQVDADTSIEEAPVLSRYMEQDTDEEANTSIEDVEQDADEADEREVREMSLSLDDDEEPAATATSAPHDEDSSSDEEELEYGLVKISSADPHAAARAAAILKQHDYDCFTRLALRTQQGRHSLSASGITKKRTPRDSLRRRTLGASIIGDKVLIPGSPATTLPELLKEAEATIVGTPTKLATSPHLFTPVPRPSIGRGLARSLFENTAKEKAWTKEEWKLLDACFTDERIALGPGDGQLASVDRVVPEDVVRRFQDLLGGEDVINEWGKDWAMENLVQRVKALQNKQRKGIVAPPTTPNTPRTSLTNPSASLFTHRLPSMEVPDFTPLGRRAAPPGRRPTLPPPVALGAPFNDLQDTPEHEQEMPKRKLPLSLLAPRYSHLLDEAVAISQLPDPSSAKSGPGNPYDSSNDGDSEEAGFEAAATDTEAGSGTVSPPSSVPTETITADPVPSSTLKTRVKGFLFSYLPTLSKKPATNPKPSSSRPGLPLPPTSVLEKCRGPITTPARAPVPKPTHPKELVHLNPAPVPPKPSLIPRPQKPQRLVELHRVSPPPPEKDAAVIRPRRSSASSVKDLVRGFEEMEKNAVAERAEEQKRGELKRVKSVGEWRKTAGLANAGGNGSKPSWRP
ncbi:hypothetical protein C0992_010806, partial [Termitomyces sp. T32_za158]